MSEPRKITRTSLAASVAEAWREQYPYDGFQLAGGQTAGEIRRALLALPAPVAPADVDRVVGNGCWTRVPECDGCGRERNRSVVRLGDPDSKTVDLCRACITKAAKLMGAAP